MVFAQVERERFNEDRREHVVNEWRAGYLKKPVGSEGLTTEVDVSRLGYYSRIY